MAPVVKWNPSFSVGHPTLDEQHLELLDLINRLADCIDDDAPAARERFHSVLNDLSDRARDHFRTEQYVLSRWNDTLLQGQQSEYEEYEDRLTNYLFSATFGTIDKVGLCQYLVDWWSKHMLDMAAQLRTAEKGT